MADQKWIDWNGDLCPVHGGVHVEVKQRDGRLLNGNAEIFDWKVLGTDDSDLVAWRLIENTNVVNDPVNHPKHYTSHPSGIECIQITEHYNFNIGNALKYCWRAGLKDADTDVQDLKKAVWYIEREIKRLESKN